MMAQNSDRRCLIAYLSPKAQPPRWGRTSRVSRSHPDIGVYPELRRTGAATDVGLAPREVDADYFAEE